MCHVKIRMTKPGPSGETFALSEQGELTYGNTTCPNRPADDQVAVLRDFAEAFVDEASLMPISGQGTVLCVITDDGREKQVSFEKIPAGATWHLVEYLQDLTRGLVDPDYTPPSCRIEIGGGYCAIHPDPDAPWTCADSAAAKVANEAFA